MDRFGKADIRKMEIETRPFGKELNAAMPWRHRMYIGLLREGPLGLGDGQKAKELPKRAIRGWMARLKLNGPFEAEWTV